MSIEKRLQAIEGNLFAYDMSNLLDAHNYCCQIRNCCDDEIYTYDYLCDEILANMEPAEIMRTVAYGTHDDEKGEVIQRFQPHCDNYFYFDGNGNLCSLWRLHACRKACNAIIETLRYPRYESYIDEILEILQLEDYLDADEEEEET